MDGSINGIGDDKMIVEVNGKRSKTRFFSPRTKLAFAEFRQIYSTALILHFLDLEYLIRD